MILMLVAFTTLCKANNFDSGILGYKGNESGWVGQVIQDIDFSSKTPVRDFFRQSYIEVNKRPSNNTVSSKPKPASSIFLTAVDDTLRDPNISRIALHAVPNPPTLYLMLLSCVLAFGIGAKGRLIFLNTN